MVGAGRVGLLERRASPTGRARSCSTTAAAGRRRSCEPAASPIGRPRSERRRATGSLWAHHMAIDGWWPSRSTASRAWRDRLLADRAGVAPLQREVLPAAACRARRRRRTARGGRCGRARAAGRGRLRRPARRRGGTRRRCASASAIRVGRQVGALDEHPLAVDRNTQSCSATSRSPVRRVPACRSTHLVDDDLDRRRRSAAGRRATAATTAAGRRCRGSS